MITCQRAPIRAPKKQKGGGRGGGDEASARLWPAEIARAGSSSTRLAGASARERRGLASKEQTDGPECLGASTECTWHRCFQGRARVLQVDRAAMAGDMNLLNHACGAAVSGARDAFRDAREGLGTANARGRVRRTREGGNEATVANQRHHKRKSELAPAEVDEAVPAGRQHTRTNAASTIRRCARCRLLRFGCGMLLLLLMAVLVLLL